MLRDRNLVGKGGQIAKKIMELMGQECASDDDALMALIVSIIVIGRGNGVTEDEALALFKEIWESYAPVVDRMREITQDGGTA